ncbi:hypothetical protein PsYK624_170990 [Phanerochaete sordida]|uniref:Uncharacterized protein n=1 Tax=Phanerochaete sordida TaxID=48140 RepID=A0A9P3LPP9_9APHY|nr:hypothetical protein PsYK624_170990 [Phanerochaete sordida]
MTTHEPDDCVHAPVEHPCIRGCCCRGQPRRVLVRSTRGSVRRGPHGAQDADAVVQAICIDICRHSNLRPASEVRALATCSAAHTKTQQAETHLSGPRAGGGALTRMQLDMASSCARGMRRCMALLRYSVEGTRGRRAMAQRCRRRRPQLACLLDGFSRAGQGREATQSGVWVGAEQRKKSVLARVDS